MPFDTSFVTKVQTVAEAIATAFSGISGLTVLDHDPVGQEIPSPCACVGEVEGGGTEIDAQGHELGHDDYPQRWTVTLYQHLDDPATAWPAARSLVGRMVAAIDFDPHLGGDVREARVTAYSLAPAEEEPGKRRLLVGELTVSVLYLMLNPT